MSDNFNEAADRMNIQENEYANGETIQFPIFSSSIGVIIQRGPNVAGFHLGRDGKFEEVIKQIKDERKEKNAKIAIVGCLKKWKKSHSEMYEMLTEKLKADETGKPIKIKKYRYNEGVYSQGLKKVILA